MPKNSRFGPASMSMSKERPRHNQPLRRTGGRPIDSDRASRSVNPSPRTDEWGMSVGQPGQWLPDFDEAFDLEEEP